ncbi:MAG: hypothetical protein QMD09_03230, partial [Desulfatibacillaceae bacterium]|nr:hypothetical protein [Desulfatibacillaceae bacterium]
QRSPIARFLAFYFYREAILLWGMMGWLAWLSLVYWAALYSLVVAGLKRLRLVCGVMMFFVITGFFFFFLWYSGGIGKALPATIAAQEGVSQVLDYREISQAIRFDESRESPFLTPLDETVSPDAWVMVQRRPRDVWYEPQMQTVFAAYGSSFHDFSQVVYPVIVSKNLVSGHIQYRLSNANLFHLWGRGDWLLAAPWNTRSIYALNKGDLSVANTIPVQGVDELPDGLWAPLAVMRDVLGHRVYVFNHFYTIVQAYDLYENRLVAQTQIDSDKPLVQGGAIWYPVQCPSTRKIYLIMLPTRESLLELDPETLGVTRSLDIGSLAQSSMVMDYSNRFLYAQFALSKTIVRVNMDTWSVDRRYKGEAFARKIALDKERNALYVLGYGSGRLFALDLDTGQRLWTLKVGGRPNGLDLKEDFLWVNSMSGVFRVDLQEVWKDKQS